MPSYYQQLEVDPSATPDEISAAFRRLAKKYHPDMNVGQEREAQTVFVRVLEAYSVLSDPRRRAKYDAKFNTSNHWGSPEPMRVYEIQPLDEFQLDRASLDSSVTLPRMRRRLDPGLRKILIFVGACVAIAVLIILFAW
jgi:curved DNA-binding protein CbpA